MVVILINPKSEYRHPKQIRISNDRNFGGLVKSKMSPPLAGGDEGEGDK
jgi:hypothetical protein